MNRMLISCVHMYFTKNIVPQISTYTQSEHLFVMVSLFVHINNNIILMEEHYMKATKSK